MQPRHHPHPNRLRPHMLPMPLAFIHPAIIVPQTLAKPIQNFNIPILPQRRLPHPRHLMVVLQLMVVMIRLRHVTLQIPTTVIIVTKVPMPRHTIMV